MRPPLTEPSRVRSRRAVEAARKPYCEHCGTMRGPFEVHHIRSRGAGGGDVGGNLINLCVGPAANDCHGKAHNAKIPREALLAIVARREGQA
jgi:hypothetical protein